MSNKLLLVAIFLVSILIIVITYVFIIDESKDDGSGGDKPYAVSYPADNDHYILTEDQKKQCQNLLANNLVGKWQYTGGELDSSTYLVLNEDNEFIFSGWGGDGKTPLGIWEYFSDTPSIKFTFYELNEYWEETLNTDDLKTMFNNDSNPEAILDYSYEEKYIKLSISYFENPDFFDGECKTSQFFIDMFNVLVYKQE